MLLTPDTLYRYDRTATILPGPDAFDDEAVQAYTRDGFIAVANVLTASEVEEARSALTDLIEGRIEGYQGLQPEPSVSKEMASALPADSIRKIWLFCKHEPRLNVLATAHPVIQNILTRLLGEPTRMIQDMALLKPPRIGTEKPWHQDAAYFEWGPPEKVIGVWIAIDPATAENGCMHTIPGTHLQGAVPHRHLRDCQIPDDKVNVAEDVIVPLEPGGAMFFSSLLHHGTPPNHSPARRWAVQFHYAGLSCEKLDWAVHENLFSEDARYRGCRAVHKE